MSVTQLAGAARPNTSSAPPVERTALPSELELPAVIAARCSQALADAIGLMEEVDRLLREWDAIDTALTLLSGGPDGTADPEGEQASRWSDLTGQQHVLSVLVAVGDRLRDATGCEGSYLREHSALQLRRRFAAFLIEPGWLLD